MVYLVLPEFLGLIRYIRLIRVIRALGLPGLLGLIILLRLTLGVMSLSPSVPIAIEIQVIINSVIMDVPPRANPNYTPFSLAVPQLQLISLTSPPVRLTVPTSQVRLTVLVVK